MNNKVLNAFLYLTSLGMMGYAGGGTDWAIFSVGVGLFTIVVINYLSPNYNSAEEPVVKVCRSISPPNPKSEYGDRSESDFT